MSSKTIYRFYVYAYLRSKDSSTAKAGTPYYIGKGSNKRAWGKHIQNNVPKDKRNIVILESDLSEIGAFVLERRYIKWYGRKDIGTGILSNRTNGGEGVSGLKVSDETRKLISYLAKGRKVSDETKLKLSIANRKPHPSVQGRKYSEEHKARIGKAKRGVKHSEEHRRNNSLARLGVKRTPHTEETKRKISKSNSKPRPAEFGEKISKALTGRKLSDSHKLSIKVGVKGKEMRTINCLLTKVSYNIPKNEKTPILHCDGAKGFKLVVIDEKFITPSKHILLNKFNILENLLGAWLQGKGSINTKSILANCKIIDTRNLSTEELNNLIKHYEWIS